MNKLDGLLGNPLFNIGMGLLSSNQRSLTPQNPVNHIMQNLMMGQQLKFQSQRDQRATEKHEAEMARLNTPVHREPIKMGKTLLDPHTYKPLYTEPESDEVIQGADGYKYYQNSGERVLPDVVAPTDYNSPFNPDGSPNQAYQDYQARLRELGANRVTVDASTNEPPYKIPNGFMLKDQNDPSQGVTPIPGSGQDALTPEQAAKTQQMRTAQDALSNVDRLLFNEDGKIDDVNVATASMNVPWTEGRELATYIEQGIQAITRGETGAAMPPEEVNNTRKRFQPSPFDNESTKLAKRKMFEDFINGTLKLIDPSGRFDSERFDEELAKRSKGSGANNTQAKRRRYNPSTGSFE